MKTVLACVVVTLIGCGSKTKSATAPQNQETGSAAVASCCCETADKSLKMVASADCTAGGGTCQATEDSCHGIEEPIP